MVNEKLENCKGNDLELLNNIGINNLRDFE